ncbi:hypothetical protein [Jeotgalibacillus soli]|uniref:Uncharacterized protein n=1 Tax=Jeotgalibacillus soli TaxID=889306 RepID=A0A0C2VMG1_9BACL|nr:hypothetical protein [Jeotgalibacillus soli]KIL45193.1 hypothetical protein KP78_27370 [Jeotgalibacillus soli]
MNGFIHTIKGHVSFIDFNKRHYRIYDENSDLHIFPFDIVVDVKKLDERIP